MREVKWLEFVESKNFRSFNRRLMYSGFVPGAFFFPFDVFFFCQVIDKRAMDPKLKPLLDQFQVEIQVSFCVCFLLCVWSVGRRVVCVSWWGRFLSVCGVTYLDIVSRR